MPHNCDSRQQRLNRPERAVAASFIEQLHTIRSFLNNSNLFKVDITKDTLCAHIKFHDYDKPFEKRTNVQQVMSYAMPALTAKRDRTSRVSQSP